MTSTPLYWPPCGNIYCPPWEEFHLTISPEPPEPGAFARDVAEYYHGTEWAGVFTPDYDDDPPPAACGACGNTNPDDLGLIYALYQCRDMLDCWHRQEVRELGTA